MQMDGLPVLVILWLLSDYQELLQIWMGYPLISHYLIGFKWLLFFQEFLLAFSAHMAYIAFHIDKKTV